MEKIKNVLKLKLVKLVFIIILIGFVMTTFSGLISTLFYYFVIGAVILLVGIVGYSFLETVFKKEKQEG